MNTNTQLPIISCDDCGLCCMHMAVPPFTTEEFIELPVEVQLSYRLVQESRDDQLKVSGADFIPCGWFDMETRRCKHHEHRPQVCRDFEVGCDDCRGFRNQAGIV